VEFDDAVTELDALVRQLEAEGDERSLRLLQLIDAIHRPGIERLAAGDRDDPFAHGLLAMYGLVEVDDERLLVEEALDEVRPYIHSHGGSVTLLDVEDGVVHVRMAGSCQGCAASALTLRRGIEAALRERVPGFREVVSHEPERPTLLQIEDLRRPVFADAAALDDLAPGTLRRVIVGDVPILLTNLGGEVYALRDGCAVDGMSLDTAQLSDAVIVCPWHNCAYDARTGKRVDGDAGEGLAVVPVAIRDGVVRAAVNVT
jgi:Fe-S cluster biogenesis protein NfuA/nitrite reductase/ring-hydroxylating ferredoxin subunit